jgi:hypothetical protein
MADFEVYQKVRSIPGDAPARNAASVTIMLAEKLEVVSGRNLLGLDSRFFRWVSGTLLSFFSSETSNPKRVKLFMVHDRTEVKLWMCHAKTLARRKSSAAL